MAITSVIQKPGTRSAKTARKSIEFSDQFQIETDDPSDNQITVITHFQSIGYKPGNLINGYRIKSVDYSDNEDGATWLATVNYGLDSESSQQSANPLNDPPKYSISGQSVPLPVDFDSSGNAIVNSAGDPFQELQFIEDERDIIQITKNFATYPSGLAKQARRKVNSGNFLGFGPKEVRYKGMSGSSSYDPTIGVYYTVTVEFETAPSWERELLDQGFRELDGGELKQIKVDGETISQPVPLDGSGGKLAANGTPVNLAFEFYETANFASIFGIS